MRLKWMEHHAARRYSSLRYLSLLLLFVSLLPSTLLAQIRGVVTTVDGHGIDGAVVEVSARGERHQTLTRNDGRFEFAIELPANLRISAAEFAPRELMITSDAEISIALERPTTAATITVTASRAGLRLGDSPSSTVTVTREELSSTAAPTIDDALRSVPGFSLFRRSGSRTANPTSQGVSLRGVGASGASRSVVLDDGVPLNDPFGGWIYWGRVPITAIDRVEIVRGGGSDLFGSAASSGAIQLIRSNVSDGVALDLTGGSLGSARASASLAAPLGGFITRLDAEYFQTDGYKPVSPGERGGVDVEADVKRQVIDASLERRSAAWRAFGRASYFEEDRNNGTKLQVNATELWSGVVGIDMTADDVFGSLRAFGSDQDYQQTFTSIAADRNSERLIRRQSVPSSSIGGSAYVTTSPVWHSNVAAGIEVRQARGRSDEEAIGATITRSSAGGMQRTMSLFVEDVTRVGPTLSVVLSGRYDRWSNSDAFRESAGNRLPLDDRSDEAFSPRLALSYRFRDRITFTTSAYDAFRAPTLNELYRSFRVGNVVTNANEALEAEKVRGYEGGVRYEEQSGRYTLRANLFSMTTNDPVANVTLTSTPSLITRQRQNLGRTRTNGLEFDGELLLGQSWRMTAGYLHSDATVVSFRANRAIEGNQLPQVPRHQGSFRLSYSGWSGMLVTAEMRWSASQFEDDLNTLELDGYSTLDLFASKLLTARWTAYSALENAFDQQVEVGRTPVTTLGQPRAWRFGVRYVR